FADNLNRRHQVLELHTLVFRRIDFPRACGHFLFRPAVEYVDLFETFAPTNPRGVHCDVSAADYYDLALGGPLLSRVHFAQEIDPVDDAFHIFALDLELHSLMCADADKYGIEIVHDLFKRDLFADPRVAAQFNPVRKDPVYLVHKRGSREPVLGDAVSKHATRFRQGFKNDGMVPLPGKETGAGKAGRSRADYRHLFLVELIGDFDRSSDPVLHFIIGDIALESADGDRFVGIPPVAGALAGMRAHTAD